ncbi:element excision factor XisI family protein [Dolichospermum compactum]
MTLFNISAIILLIIIVANPMIWIQRDGTEIGIANELMAADVSKEDIVLGFHDPYKRQFTGFAVG